MIVDTALVVLPRCMNEIIKVNQLQVDKHFARELLVESEHFVQGFLENCKLTS